MLKRLLTILIALTMTLGVVACSDDESDDNGGTDTMDIEDTGGDTEEDTEEDTGGDTEEDTGDDTADDTGEDTAGDTTGDTDEDTSSDMTDAGDTEDDTADMAEDMGEDIPMVSMMCSEAGLEECFINDDCAMDQRCQDIGSGDLEVPCCVVGPRGTGVAGEECTEDIDCETSLCVDGLCSQLCENMMGCPDNMRCSLAVGICVPQ